MSYDIYSTVTIDSNDHYIPGSDNHNYPREIDTPGYWTKAIPEERDEVDNITQPYVAPEYIETVYKQVVITEATGDITDDQAVVVASGVPASELANYDDAHTWTETTAAVLADFPLNIIPVPPPQGFHVPKWSGVNPWVGGEGEDKWVEGKPASELLELEKETKRNEIRQAFVAAESQPIDVIGFTWNGGELSGLRLDAERRAAQENLETGVSYHDINNAKHVITFEQAASVVLEIRHRYKTNYDKKQQLMRDIDAAVDLTAVNEVVWV